MYAATRYPQLLEKTMADNQDNERFAGARRIARGEPTSNESIYDEIIAGYIARFPDLALSENEGALELLWRMKLDELRVAEGQAREVEHYDRQRELSDLIMLRRVGALKKMDEVDEWDPF